MCVCVCVCRVALLERPWCVRAAKTLASLCAEALESALICADFYNSSKSKYILHLSLIACIVKKNIRKTNENINLSFFRE